MASLQQMRYTQKSFVRRLAKPQNINHQQMMTAVKERYSGEESSLVNSNHQSGTGQVPLVISGLAENAVPNQASVGFMPSAFYIQRIQDAELHQGATRNLLRDGNASWASRSMGRQANDAQPQ
jgi:hypothetical protein